LVSIFKLQYCIIQGKCVGRLGVPVNGLIVSMAQNRESKRLLSFIATDRSEVGLCRISSPELRLRYPEGAHKKLAKSKISPNPI